jgi:hypothetical protein
MSCPNCGLRIGAYVMSCPGCGASFDGSLGDEEWLDTNGFTERAGLGFILGLFSTAACYIVAGGLGFLEPKLSATDLMLFASGALLPLVFLAISWMRAGCPNETNRLKATHHLVDPYRVGLFGPPLTAVIELTIK